MDRRTFTERQNFKGKTGCEQKFRHLLHSFPTENKIPTRLGYLIPLVCLGLRTKHEELQIHGNYSAPDYKALQVAALSKQTFMFQVYS